MSAYKNFSPQKGAYFLGIARQLSCLIEDLKLGLETSSLESPLIDTMKYNYFIYILDLLRTDNRESSINKGLKLKGHVESVKSGGFTVPKGLGKVTKSWNF